MTTIKVSEIIDQVSHQDVFLEGLGYHLQGIFGGTPDTVVGDGQANPPFALFFRNQQDFLENNMKGWFFMRVWFLRKGQTGYLRDTICPFSLKKDVPLEILWNELREFYTMQKLADDPITMNQERYLPSRVGKLLNLVHDKRNPESGYYSPGRDDHSVNLVKYDTPWNVRHIYTGLKDYEERLI